MKHAGAVIAFLIFVFWASMNFLVYLRQERMRNLDQYRQGMTKYLGNEFFRECWMGIYRNNKRVGHTGSIFEKLVAEDGFEVHSTVEAKMELEILGRKLPMALQGSLVADEALKPLTLRFEATSSEMPLITLTGRREGKKFLLAASRESLVFFKTELELEGLHLGNGLVPVLPLADLKVGETFDVPCFDPVALKRDLATATVVAKESKEIEGFKADVYLIETRFRDMTAKSWVTGAGELLRQEFGPPLADLVLRRETRDLARKLSGR